jgi:acyl-[acyl-carrier-protein]-phospholipid O-acyltransferase/long-chain-fatty-acid--[acyl-carrier-protein] ligase
MIPVVIEKGEKNKKPRIFKRILNRFRVPAEITFGKDNNSMEKCINS